jgi:protocatechuate 3,4-dioxygenase beta subunit
MTSKTVFGLALILSCAGIPGLATPLRLTGLATAPGGPMGEVRIEIAPAYRRVPGGKRAAPAASVQARADGFFTLTVPEPGIYRAVVRADGFVPLEITLLPVVEETDLPPVELEPALPLEVRVTGPEGRPAAWVAVCARSWEAPKSAEPRWEPAERCGTAGEDGRLVLPRGRKERPVLTVADPRFAAGRFETGEEGAVTLRLAAARVVPLDVRDPDGKPVAGVAARIGADGSLGNGGITDPAGRLAVAVPETGAEVMLAGEEGLRGRAVFFPGDAGPRTVTLASPRIVTGRIVDAATRRPIAGALVWTSEAEARTGADGAFRIPAGSGPGLRIGAVAAGHGRRWLALPSWGTNVVTLALPAAGSLIRSTDMDAAERLRTPAEELPSTRVLLGRVLGPDGRPVAGAWVETARMLAAETDGEGRFRLAGLGPGATVSLRARAPGLRGSAPSSVVSRDGIPEPLEIRLAPAAALDGRVTDAAGRPAAGVPVLLETLGEDSGEETPAGDPAAGARTLTDDDGRYAFDSLEPGRRRLSALRPGGRRLAGASLDLHNGPNRLDLAQPPALSVSGRVLDDAGAPLAGARVFLEGPDPEDRWLVVGAEDGGFSFGGIPEGDYRLSVLAKGFAQPVPREVQVASSAVQGLELRLRRGGTIVGNLAGVSAEELNGLMIVAEEKAPGPGSGRAAPAARSRRLGLAGPDGRYRIPDIPPGVWKVTGRTAAGRQALASVEVVPGSGETALDLRFTSGLTLSGRLLVDGLPAAGSVLATAADGAGGEGGQAAAGPDGSFAIPGLQPGSYLLLVLLDSMLWPLRTVELTADREIPLEIATGTLSGRIVGPFGSPLAGAQVSLRPRTLGIQAFLPSPRARSDEQGAFELPRIPAGSHRLLVTRDGATPFETAVTVPAGGAVRVEVPLGL